MNKLLIVFKSFKYYYWCAFSLAALWLVIVLVASVYYKGINLVECLAITHAFSLCFFVWLAAAFRLKSGNKGADNE